MTDQQNVLSEENTINLAELLAPAIIQDNVNQQDQEGFDEDEGYQHDGHEEEQRNNYVRLPKGAASMELLYNNSNYQVIAYYDINLKHISTILSCLCCLKTIYEFIPN